MFCYKKSPPATTLGDLVAMGVAGKANKEPRLVRLKVAP